MSNKQMKTCHSKEHEMRVSMVETTKQVDANYNKLMPFKNKKISHYAGVGESFIHVHHKKTTVHTCNRNEQRNPKIAQQTK